MRTSIPILMLAVLTMGQAQAADTTELFDLGASDVEFFVGFDGVGANTTDQALWGDLLLGMGLTPGLSAYIGSTMSGDTYFTRGMPSLYHGLFGTPVDTDHLDVDLFLEFSSGGYHLDEFGVTPAVELNLDLAPDLERAGLYVLVGAPLSGDTRSDPPTRHVDLEFNLGAYYTLKPGQQILLETDLAITGVGEAGSGSEFG